MCAKVVLSNIWWSVYFRHRFGNGVILLWLCYGANPVWHLVVQVHRPCFFLFTGQWSVFEQCPAQRLLASRPSRRNLLRRSMPPGLWAWASWMGTPWSGWNCFNFLCCHCIFFCLPRASAKSSLLTSSFFLFRQLCTFGLCFFSTTQRGGLCQLWAMAPAEPAVCTENGYFRDCAVALIPTWSRGGGGGVEVARWYFCTIMYLRMT